MNKKYVQNLFGLALCMFSFNIAWGQLSVTATKTNFTIDFESTVTGVNNGQYTGAGFASSPGAGQLDSDAWTFTGVTGLAQGESDGDVSGAGSGGFFDFNTGGGNATFGIDPKGSEFTPGTVTLEITNNTGSTVVTMALGYIIWINNKGDKSSSLNFSYSTNGTDYTDVSYLDYTSPTTNTGAIDWQSNTRTTTLSGISITNGSSIFLRWAGDDVVTTGTGRDEYALDDIVVNMSDDPSTTWEGDDGGSPTDWATAANWSNGIPTAGLDVRILNVTNKPIVGAATNAAANNLTVDASSSLSITGGGSLTASGNLTNNGTLTVNAAASLLVTGTSFGNITYNVNVADTNWHLISAPVEGEQYDDAWNTLNSINVSGTGLNDGVSTYDNTTDADGNWDYFQTGGAATTFNTGQGYSLLRTGAGDYGFIGTMKTTDASIAITANDIGGGGENRWTLIGNPFPSFMSIDDFLGLAANATALEDSREAVYVWNGTAYVAVTTGHLHPGQGFFVNSNVASTNVAINENMLSHQTGITFYRNGNTDPYIELILSDGQNTKMTEIKYADGKTTGLDPRFDIGTFTGTSNSFHVYTQLISDNQNVNFMRQTLPNNNHESLIVPVGVNADAGEEITFTANALNIPNGLNVFIEDRELGLYTQLDVANAEYAVTLTDNLNGIGRFYLHTNTQSALSTGSFDLNTVSIYKTSTTNLRIAGLQHGNAAISIFDILGKKVLQTSFEATGVHDITLPKVKTGVYIIRLSTDNGTLNKKIIIE